MKGKILGLAAATVMVALLIPRVRGAMPTDTPPRPGATPIGHSTAIWADVRGHTPCLARRLSALHHSQSRRLGAVPLAPCPDAY
jgi:hypothetical protein